MLYIVLHLVNPSVDSLLIAGNVVVSVPVKRNSAIYCMTGKTSDCLCVTDVCCCINVE